MTDLRALLFARQRNYTLIIDTTKAWATEKNVTAWAPMYRAVLAGVVGAGGVTFADEVAPDKAAATAAVRAFLERVPVTGSIAGDVQLADPAAVIADEDVQRARDIIDYWDSDFFLADQAVKGGAKGDKGDPGPPGPPGGGALRGAVWLDELPGSSPADKLRRAWAPGSQDRRPIVVPHGTTIDAGSTPIPVPAGVTLMGPAGPQTEFSDSGRVP